MLTNEVTLNIYLFLAVMILSVLAGFSIRARMTSKARAKIEELEKEIMDNYEHILELEKETLNMESHLQNMKSPVITMLAPPKEEAVTSKKVPDISLRKQLLSKKAPGKQSASGL